jgi:hypothetical protein
MKKALLKVAVISAIAIIIRLLERGNSVASILGRLTTIVLKD